MKQTWSTLRAGMTTVYIANIHDASFMCASCMLPRVNGALQCAPLGAEWGGLRNWLHWCIYWQRTARTRSSCCWQPTSWRVCRRSSTCLRWSCLAYSGMFCPVRNGSINPRSYPPCRSLCSDFARDIFTSRRSEDTRWTLSVNWHCHHHRKPWAKCLLKYCRPTLAIALLTWVRLVTRNALQSRKWQLIGMS